MVDLRVRLLGPVRLEVNGRAARLGAQLRLILAVLAMAGGRPVPRPRMVDLLWPDEPPAGAPATLRSHVAHLRRVLEPDRRAGQPPRVLITDEHGYALRLRPGQLDTAEFERLLTDARRAHGGGDAAAAADRLAAALALWDGEALSDVAERPFAVREAARLRAMRTAARRLRAEVELGLGRHEQVVGELAELVAAQPRDEQLCGQLALALYRCRQPEAAAQACADGLRRRRADGLDSPALQALHTDILRRRPQLDWQPAPRPFQLPPDVAEFTGRADELAALANRLCRGAAASAAAASVVVAVDGTPGVGKSALVVHLAHRLAPRYPDGVLYVNLRGAEPQRVDPADALGQFLRALGAPEAPAGLDAAAAAFRSAVGARRVLVVLDNAADAAQVRPLLPASPGCATLITSRRQLADLDGATPVPLDLLPTHEAVDLLARLAGRERADADPGSARAVVRYCGLLPLAVRIAAARLRARPAWSMASFAGRLADEHRRLGELAVGDLDVRSSFLLSYRGLDAADARLFRLLGLLDGADVGIELAAAVAQRPVADTEAALERLVDAQLLETRAVGRYRFHDLLRLFARQLAEEADDAPAREAAVARALHRYLCTAQQARDATMNDAPRYPDATDHPFQDEHAALDWLDLERANLVAAVKQAATAAPAPACAVAWQLSHVLIRYFALRSNWSDWASTCHAALDAAERVGEWRVLAITHRFLGTMCNQQRRPDEALHHLRACLALFRANGDRFEEAKALLDLGNAHSQLGQLEEASRCGRETLAAARRVGDRRLEVRALNNLGLLLGHQGCFAEAVDHLRLALRILDEIGERMEVSIALDSLGIVYRQQGRHADSMECYRRCLATARTFGDRYHEAVALHGLGLAADGMDGTDTARPYWRQALAIFRSLNAAEAADVERLLTEPAARG